MKVACLHTAPLAILLCSLYGCSDPPAPPPQAAVTVKVSPTNGKPCPASGSYFSVPTNEITGVLTQLNCDLSMGCKPDKYVVVDRDTGAMTAAGVVARISAVSIAENSSTSRRISAARWRAGRYCTAATNARRTLPCIETIVEGSLEAGVLSNLSGIG